MFKYLILLLTFTLFHCTQTQQTAGTADDFPNAIAYEDSVEIANLGTELNNNLNITNNWNALTNAPDYKAEHTEIISENEASSTPALKQAIAIADTYPDTSWANYSDTANGRLYFYEIKNKSTHIQFDTILMSYDTFSKDNIADNERIIEVRSLNKYHNSNATTHTKYEDADGDGFITPNLSSTSSPKAKSTTTTFAFNMYKEAIFIIDAGADYNFDTEPDNNFFYGHEHTFDINYDTLSYTQYSDGDQDGYLTLTSTDSSIVSIVKIIRNALIDSKEKSTLVYFPNDDTRNYPISYQKTESIGAFTKLGTITHNSGAPSFYPGDSVIVEEITHTILTGDTVKTQTDSIKAILSTTPGLDSLSQGYYYKTTIQRFKEIESEEKERETSFALTPETPLIDGEDFSFGSFTWSLTRFDNTTITLDGEVTPTGRTANLSMNNLVYYVHWNANGDIDSIAVIP